jgi:hypothetical protein
MVRRQFGKAFISFIIIYGSFGGWVSIVPVILLYFIVDMYNSKDRAHFNKSLLWFVITILVIAIALFAYYFNFKSHPTLDPVSVNVKDIRKVFNWWYHVLGSPFQLSGGRVVYDMGRLFVVLFVFLVAKKKFRDYPFAFYTIIWAMAVTFIISAGRAGTGDHYPMLMVRYWMFAVIGWCVLCAVIINEYSNWLVKGLMVFLAIAVIHNTYLGFKKDIPYGREFIAKGLECFKKVYIEKDPNVDRECLNTYHVFPVEHKVHKLLKYKMFEKWGVK